MNEAARAAATKAANRLHHLSMRYSGALVELTSQQPVALLAQKHPGLREARDLIDCILLCRAEINALTALLLKAGFIKEEDTMKQMAEEYEYMAQAKAKFLGVEVNDAGIVFHNPKTQN